MTDLPASTGSADSGEILLRDQVARSDAVIGTIAPILRHLLTNDDSSVFGEDVIARVRGMTLDVARQLLDELALAAGETERRDHPAERLAPLTDAIIASPAFLGHVHAQALEWQLTERLQARLSLDPVLPPLLQALMASPDGPTAALAMHTLAAQARWCQAQRRMRLPLSELPGDLLHGVLVAMHTIAGPEPAAEQCAAKASAAIRAGYDEGGSRLALVSRLVTGMGGGAVAALSLGHAGVAIFLTALSVASGQDRDVAIVSTNEGQIARLALALRAAGLKPAAIEEQLLALHPDAVLPQGFERLGADRAAAILALAGGCAGG
jgi:hypothetical protein